MNFTLKIAVLALGFLSCCKSEGDIESYLDDAIAAINKLVTSNSGEEYLDVLTSLDDWGTKSVLSIAMTFFVISSDGDWEQDEVSVTTWNKYLALKTAMKALNSKISVDKFSFADEFKSLESQLKRLDQKSEEIVKNSQNADHQKKNFYFMYEADHINASEKIFTDMTTETNNMFRLGELKNDKRETFNLVKKTTVMLLQSISIDTAYKLFKVGSEDDTDSILSEISNMWKSRFTQLERIFSQLNTDLTNAWSTQYQSDVDSFLKSNQTSLPSNTMAESLQSLLTQKFYWRNWFVVIADNKGSDDVAINACDGLTRTVQSGKTQKLIFVNSGDVKEPFNGQLFDAHQKRVDSHINIFFTSKRAHEINAAMSASCRDFKMFGTIIKSAVAGIVGRKREFETSTKRFWFFENTKFRSFLMG